VDFLPRTTQLRASVKPAVVGVAYCKIELQELSS
jgi:hypothetical protein